MRFPKYPQYQDSNVDWLGPVPSRWNLRSFRYSARIKNGCDFKQFEVTDGGYPVMGSGGEFARVSRFLYDKPSVLLGRKGTIDNPLFIDKPFWTVDTLFYTEVFPTTNPKFLYYFCRNIPFGFFQYGSAVPSMTQNDIYEMIVPVPPIEEQRQIASFLDQETAKIDALITEQQRLIELLKEKRQAVISHAVTKGLNPDVRMKPSGVEWLGEVPEHWEVLKLARAFSVIGSGTTPKSDESAFYEDGSIPWVNTGDLNDGIVVDPSRRITEVALKTHSSLKIYPKGALVMAMYGATIGKVGILGLSSTVNQACCVFAQSEKLSQKFLFYLFLAIRNHLVSLATGGGQPNISQEILRMLRVVGPPPVEQEEITRKLDFAVGQFAELIAQADKSITLLQERRTALISAAVTGKIDVRNYASTQQDAA